MGCNKLNLISQLNLKTEFKDTINPDTMKHLSSLVIDASVCENRKKKKKAERERINETFTEAFILCAYKYDKHFAEVSGCDTQYHSYVHNLEDLQCIPVTVSNL